MPLDLVEQVRRVPEVPDVELDADRGRAGLVDELDGLAQRVDDRPALEALALERLEREPEAGALGFGAELAQALDDEGPARPRSGAARAAGDAEDGSGAKGGETVDRPQDRVDPLPRVGRAGRPDPALAGPTPASW